MKYFFLLAVTFCSFFLYGQEKFSKELSFITDNDLYISKTRDRYYTSGIFMSYKYVSDVKKDNLEKRIIEWQLVQEMYTPFKAIVPHISLHDRPFAGYLYGSFGINRIFKNHKIFNTSIQIGVLGSNSYAKELQEVIHNIYGFKKAVGWEHQIKNAFALNFRADYHQFLFKNESNHFDVTWLNSAKLGTIYTNVTTGLYGRIGFIPLQSILNSIGFNTSLNNKNNNYFREAESFIYVKPTLRYALYDATLQGSFLNTGSKVTKELVPFVFNIEIGLRFTLNRFNFGYAFHYNTSKSKDLRHPYGNKYGKIIINYLLR